MYNHYVTLTIISNNLAILTIIIINNKILTLDCNLVNSLFSTSDFTVKSSLTVKFVHYVKFVLLLNYSSVNNSR